MSTSNASSASVKPAISTDPESGLKVFNTRAAKANEKIAGKGYSTISDEKLKTLPEVKPGAVFNAREQAKYREFKEARAGAADYMEMDGEFSRYLEDVYSALRRTAAVVSAQGSRFHRCALL